MESKGRRVKEKEKKGLNFFSKIVITGLFLACVAVVINLAPNYIQNKLAKKTNLIINNNNVTSSLKKDVKVENDVIYLSFDDVKNFFDENIYYDKQYKQIITSSDTKLASLEIGKKQMYINSSKTILYAPAIEDDGTYYLPISEMDKVYNVEIKFSKDTNIISVDSLDREQKIGNSSKNASVKYKPTTFSKTLDKLKQGDSVVVIGQSDGWYKVRTGNGIIGYVKEIANISKVREDFVRQKQINGKVSLVWDSYYSGNAPSRTESIDGINVVSPSFARLKEWGKGEFSISSDSSMKAYVSWAHNNGYKVWPMVANDSQKATTSEILNDYKLRETLINNIVNMVVKYDLDGINIDFEYMKQEDKNLFTQFLIELAPRFRELDKVLSVDVTAPDGSEDWSGCYDRHRIAKVADYIIYMAYDQYGISSPKEGTTAGADWVETNIKKFIGKQEEVDKDKLILAMPFYTRLWKIDGDNKSSSVIFMKSVDSNIPEGVQKTWNEDLKQYYVEYQKSGYTYKIWIEDEKSIKAKFDLMHKYELAGAAYWQKDFESSNIWSVIKSKIKK